MTQPKEKQINMFGETIDQMEEAKPDHLNHSTYSSMILSDAQQKIEEGDYEKARQFINKAKYFNDQADAQISRLNRVIQAMRETGDKILAKILKDMQANTSLLKHLKDLGKSEQHLKETIKDEIKVPPPISAIVEGGELLDQYLVDESFSVSNAGGASEYLYDGRVYVVTVWSERAEENHGATVSDITYTRAEGYLEDGNLKKLGELKLTPEEKKDIKKFKREIKSS